MDISKKTKTSIRGMLIYGIGFAVFFNEGGWWWLLSAIFLLAFIVSALSVFFDIRKNSTESGRDEVEYSDNKENII